jgi:hypothetical protein
MPYSIQRSFSANHPFLFSRTGYRSSVVFDMRDDATRRGHRIDNFHLARINTPSQCCCVFGNVESPDEICLAIESVKPDTKHRRSSNAPVPADGAEGSFIS